MLTRGGNPAISIIVPVYREREMVAELCATLEPFFGLHEIIIVDGESEDGTFDLLVQRGIGKVLRNARGRARQMNAGASVSSGHVLLFLHADTIVEPEGPELALRAIDRGADAGCFLVSIKSKHRRLKLGAALQSMRSRLWVSATGDQSLFVRASVFRELGGFREDMPICEDLDFVRRLSEARGPRKFACVPHHVTTSGRRWEKRGINRTIALMWGLRAAYHLGADPARLVRYYGAVR